VVHFTVGDQGIVLRGFTVGVEEGEPWGIHDVIDPDEGWRLRLAIISDHAGFGDIGLWSNAYVLVRSCR
jgi:hypothetical protein